MNNEIYGTEILPFDKPLTSRQRKYFVEYLSLESLKYCFGDNYSDFFVDDKPDIQDRNGLVGIEVTEAISRGDAQIEGEYVRYRIKNEKKSKERSKAIIEARGGRLDELSLSYPVKNGEIEKRLFQETLEKKMEKIEVYRKKGFKNIGLIIYYAEPPIPFKMTDIKLWIDDVMKRYDDLYDILFFLCPYAMIKYDINVQDIQITVIEKEQYNILQYNARKSLEKK